MPLDDDMMEAISASSLATAKKQFNLPASQLAALFPSIPAEDIDSALSRSEEM